ncbi:hypothetical protein QEJ31_02595 [Pigmentibacter sp. JX0631]|uniref:hypothetical protein n=1 Tax=Pigmentibacter sp. JX0631 TaxID=2976982 RepID=UPI00246905E0|nr:hypothetical protein [Pigmentibacter sp. JX0631]WGL60490.1 hypothetical protein QEJ31_02595 [Pigmentibacter sp. JX0631]
MLKIKFLISIYCFLISINSFSVPLQISITEKNKTLFKNSNLNSKENICNLLLGKIKSNTIFFQNVFYDAYSIHEINKIPTEFRYGIHTHNTISESCVQETEKKVKFSVERINPPVVIKNDSSFQLPKFDIYFEIIDGYWEITHVESGNCFSLLSETLKYRYSQLSEKYKTVVGYDTQFKNVEKDSCPAHAKAVMEHFIQLLKN